MVRILLTMLLGAVVVLDGSAAAQPSSAASGDFERLERIARWLEDLDSERFVVRNAAARELLDAGEVAIPLLAAQLNQESVEANWRALQILLHHCRYGDPHVSRAALDALEGVARSSNSMAARRANAALEEHRGYHHARAVALLRDLGARVIEQGREASEVQIDQRWRGSDDDLAYLQQLQGLRKVTVSNSEVGEAALSHLAEVKSVERLFLGESKIRGDGLGKLAALPKLTYLSLRGLSLSDVAAGQLGQLRTLEHLGLDDTPITDATLEQLTPLTNLQTLWLNRTKITDAGLAHLSAFPKLNKLYLSGVQLEGHGLGHLAALPNLRYLSLQYAPIQDAAAVHLQNVQTLESLGLDDTLVTDAAIAKLQSLPNLRELWLTNTQVGDGSLRHLKQMTNLRRLEVPGCKFTPQVLDELEMALPECRVRR